MSDGDQSDKNPLRRLTLCVLTVGIFIVGAFGVNWFLTTRALREQDYQIPTTNCQHSNNCDEKALKIQAREATTSDVALDISFAQALLSFLGVGGVGLTILYAKKTWRESRRSADAASAALAHAQEASERQLRAYVSVSLGGVEGFLSGDQVYASIRVQNTGQTPATQLVAHLTTAIISQRYGKAQVLHLQGSAGKALGATLTMGAGEERYTHINRARFSNAQIESVRDGSKYFCVAGRVTYFDVFEKPRTSWFCHTYYGNDFSAIAGRYHAFGNHAD
jgi:hypothetical protein